MFCNIRFPEDISLEFVKSINFNTEINTTKNLNEQRVKLLDYCYNTYEINYKNVTSKKLEKIVSFFNIVNGRYSSFRFKDWLDYKAYNQLIGIYSNDNEFQLVKNYSVNSSINKVYTRTITKPVENTIKIYINNIETNNFIVNISTGTVAIKSKLNENDIITADFEFDTAVRFFSDNLVIKNNTKNISEIEELKLTEVLNE